MSKPKLSVVRPTFAEDLAAALAPVKRRAPPPLAAEMYHALREFAAAVRDVLTTSSTVSDLAVGVDVCVEMDAEGEPTGQVFATVVVRSRAASVESVLLRYPLEMGEQLGLVDLGVDAFREMLEGRARTPWLHKHLALLRPLLEMRVKPFPVPVYVRVPPEGSS